MDTPSRRPGYSPLGRKTCFLVRWTEWQGRNEYGWDGFYPELVIWENLFFADNRLRLFMHETKQIVGATYSFSSHSAPFPSRSEERRVGNERRIYSEGLYVSIEWEI